MGSSTRGAVGSSRPRRATSERDKEERRAEILAAAKQVFAEKGFHATTVADVARAAGLSYGSVYWYFESKDVLFHELMQSEAQALREHVNSEMAVTGGPPASAFRAAVRATFEFFEGDREAVTLLFRDSYALGDRFEKHLFGIYEGFVADIEESIEEAQRRGQIVGYPARMVAFSVAALVGELALRRVFTDDGLDAEAAARLVVELLLNGLLPRAGSKG